MHKVKKEFTAHVLFPFLSEANKFGGDKQT